MIPKLGEAISSTDFFLTDGLNSSERHSGSIGSGSPFARGLLSESFAMVGVLVGGGCPSFLAWVGQNFQRA
jgi:hypothetical protein